MHTLSTEDGVVYVTSFSEDVHYVLLLLRQSIEVNADSGCVRAILCGVQCKTDKLPTRFKHVVKNYLLSTAF